MTATTTSLTLPRNKDVKPELWIKHGPPFIKHNHCCHPLAKGVPAIVRDQVKHRGLKGPLKQQLGKSLVPSFHGHRDSENPAGSNLTTAGPQATFYLLTVDPVVA